MVCVGSIIRVCRTHNAENTIFKGGSKGSCSQDAFLVSLKDFKALRRKGNNAGKAFKDFFALKDEPAFFSIVTVPARTRMRVGIVGNHPKLGRGGAIQYELLKNVDVKLWSKPSPIKGN